MTSMPTCLGHCMPDPLVLRGIVRILKIRFPSSSYNGHSTLGIKLGPLFMESSPVLLVSILSGGAHVLEDFRGLIAFSVQFTIRCGCNGCCGS